MKALMWGFRILVILALTAPVLIEGGPSWARDSDPDCGGTVERWERIIHDLKVKVDEFRNIQRMPLERMVDRPIVDAGANKSIARQVAEAMQVKEDLLNQKRKECRTLLDAENDLFSRVERCADAEGGAKKSEVKRLVKQRSTVVQGAITTIAEVREVEGKDSYTQYVDTWRGQPSGFRGRPGANYWQAYPGYGY
ncbi:MAG: hypothetical protein LDL33_13710 [Desulfomonile sp.]|nr:hypothetical protein [Desulfomonile sp.]